MRFRWSRIWWWNITRADAQEFIVPLTRRTFLATTAAVGLIARGDIAFAAPASFKHGEFEITVVSDGHLLLPANFLAPGAPPAEREALLRQSGQAGEQFQSPTNVTLLRTTTDLILVDMGRTA
jgi:hypothetical protein